MRLFDVVVVIVVAVVVVVVVVVFVVGSVISFVGDIMVPHMSILRSAEVETTY